MDYTTTTQLLEKACHTLGNFPCPFKISPEQQWILYDDARDAQFDVSKQTYHSWKAKDQDRLRVDTAKILLQICNSAEFEFASDNQILNIKQEIESFDNLYNNDYQDVHQTDEPLKSPQSPPRILNTSLPAGISVSHRPSRYMERKPYVPPPTRFSPLPTFRSITSEHVVYIPVQAHLSNPTKVDATVSLSDSGTRRQNLFRKMKNILYIRTKKSGRISTSSKNITTTC